jgi:hypothetical protein
VQLLIQSKRNKKIIQQYIKVIHANKFAIEAGVVEIGGMAGLTHP